MFNQLYLFLNDLFFSLQADGKDEWCIVSFDVPLKLLTGMYKNALLEGYDEIEKLPLDKKTKYWDIACKYYHTTEERIKAAKAAYALGLITATV